MAEDLRINWKIPNVTVVYDKANSSVFQLMDDQDKHNFFKKFKEFSIEDSSYQTRFTQLDDDGIATLKDSRPILLVSSTSYTEDERIEELFEAMQDYEVTCNQLYNDADNKREVRKLILVVTGSGPRKASFKTWIQKHQKSWNHIEILMIWFEADDYPRILAASDLGICLHYSSSGLDTPMKIIDMYGAGLPVLAAQYPCIKEVVTEMKTGELFEGREQLAAYLLDIGTNWKFFSQKIKKMRKHVIELRRYSWRQEWSEKVKPLVERLEGNKTSKKHN